ncbi:MAG TPA: RNA methyltransferase [Thermoanaerobaculia bacterium]|jgi:23S rRNA (guanosine2251-2'-O)-methyltransferase
MDFVYGFHPVREILRHRPHAAAEVLLARRRGGQRSRGGRVAEIVELCRRHRLPVREVGEAELSALAAGGTHNGFAVRLRSGKRTAASETAVPETAAGADPDLVVLVEDVQDPRNLGALLRVCESAGVGRVLVRDRGSAPLTSAAVRTSAGASEWLDVERVVNSAREIERLKAEGFWVYGAAPGGDPPWEHDLTGKVLLCVGGEEKGLRPRTRGLCDRLVGLPMRGRVESLNLATAAAALLYEAVRQRMVALTE